MSRSYRTQKESVIAERRMPRDNNGDIEYPRVVERKASRGDIHPLSKSALNRLFRNMLPIEYLYGLKRIELRPRKNSRIGCPFGEYQWDERVIRLYSLPLEWNLDYFDKELLDSITKYHKNIGPAESGERLIYVKWPEEPMLGMWYYSYVLTHELGHHFNEQYKAKKKRLQTFRHEEMVADLHSKRLTAELHKELERRVKARKPASE